MAITRAYILVNIFNIASKQFFHPKVVSFFIRIRTCNQNIITRTTMLTTDSNAPMPSNSKLSHSNNFQFYTTILSNELTPRSDRHQNQQRKQTCIILQTIVNHFKYKIILSRSNNNTMDNLATWLTYKMYRSYILGISFKPEFYKSGLSLPGMFANIWIGQRDFELTKSKLSIPDSDLVISQTGTPQNPLHRSAQTNKGAGHTPL